MTELTDMDRYNSGQYLADNPEWHADDSPFKAANIRTMIHRAGLAPSTIVEVGCGAGGVIADIARAFPDAKCVGYEVSVDAMRLCARHSAPNLRYALEDFSRVDSQSDIAISCDVLEHVDDYLGFIRMLGQKARHVFLNIPLEISVAAVLLKQFSKSRSKWGHLHFFTRETAIASVEHAGLSIEQSLVALGGIARANGFAQKVAAIPRILLLPLGRSFSSMMMGGCSLVVHARPSAIHCGENAETGTP